ncbi:guanylate kinase [Candidatus Dependentiae bacterium]|nr:guanylate kinase [Candidatus Dependentiae bacterium]
MEKMEKSTNIGKLFVISACSGAGKTSVSRALLKKYGNDFNLKKVITSTSRSPRSGELNGVDYNFLSVDEFKSHINQGFFLETTEYAGNFYGSPASILKDLEQGKSYLMVTDRPGALVIKKLVPAAVLIWLLVPDFQTLCQRLQNRGTDSPEVIARRLALAQEEMSQEQDERSFDYHVQNNVFDITVEQVKNIIEQELQR